MSFWSATLVRFNIDTFRNTRLQMRMRRRRSVGILVLAQLFLETLFFFLEFLFFFLEIIKLFLKFKILLDDFIPGESVDLHYSISTPLTFFPCQCFGTWIEHYCLLLEQLSQRLHTRSSAS